MVREQSGRQVIRAAGALVWREADGVRRVAAIHRARYDDWTLPKGKLQPGEGWEEAAVREIREETGCRIELGSFAGSASYLADGAPKLVLFWNATLLKEGEFQSSEEVAAVEWLPPALAVRRIQYPAERRVLMENREEWRERRAAGGVLRSWLGRLWHSESHQRLAGALDAFAWEFECRGQGAVKSAGDERPWWTGVATLMVQRARQALDENDTERGWSCYHAARRAALFGLEGEALRSAAQATLQEARAKLGSWRKAAVEAMLVDGKGLRDDLTPEAVYWAADILQEHHTNEWRKTAIVKRQLAWLSLITLLAVGTAIWYTSSRLVAEDRLLVPMLLYGLMGACFSGLLPLITGSRTGGKYPRQLLSFWSGLARLAVGVAAPLIIYACLHSGIFEAEKITSQLVLALSFASGFSERLVVRAVKAAESSQGA